MRRLVVALALIACAAITPINVAWADVITVCQCNIFSGGRWTEQNTGTVTYNTAERFAQWVAAVNPPGSIYPPIAVIGMQELLSETDRIRIKSFLESKTGVAWDSQRVAQGVNSTSGIGWFWRPDLVETRGEWYLGEKTLEIIDNGYLLKFAGRLFNKLGDSEAFGVFTGKLLWGGGILNGHEVTEEERRQEAVRLKTWILNGEPGSPGMSMFPGTTRVITTDLNTDTGTSTWNEMNLEYTDPSSQHTHNSFSGGTWMDLFGKRLDYIWWDYDSYAKRTGGFADGPRRSDHFGSDHRAVYATINLHPVDLVPPQVTVTAPENGAVISQTTRIAADAEDESGVLQVQFFVDGSSVWTDTSAPYEFYWNPAGYSAGYHTITAVATDGSTNRLKGSSPPVVVWVSPDGTLPTISDAKLSANGTIVALAGKVVTAAFADHFYIQEPDRSAGIKITNAAAPALGSVVTVLGEMKSLNNERHLVASSVTVQDTVSVPEPFGMRNGVVGGGPLGSYTPGVFGSHHAHNIGLLIRTWGKVTKVIDSYYMYIDDGELLADGYGYTGLRVDISGLSGWNVPAVGKYVEVTGISTTSIISGKTQPRVKVRTTSDVRVMK